MASRRNGARIKASRVGVHSKLRSQAMRKCANVLMGAIALLTTAAVMPSALAADSQPPGPLEKLRPMQGHWTYSGQFYETANSHAGPSRGAMDCNLMPNKGYLSCDILSSIPEADTGIRANDLSLFSYSPSEKSYLHFVIFDSVSPLGERLTIDGNRWVSHSELTVKGKTIMLRDFFVFSSADKLDQTSQISIDNGRTWLTRWHAIAVRAAT